MAKSAALPKIIQLEVTTACQLQCIFCPHTVMKDNWISAHLDGDIFYQILPHLQQAELVHLQGWGEPLLHPRLWDMAIALKQGQSKVSLTTNGMLLDKTAIGEIQRTGVDLVAVSIAGAKAATNDSLRTGSQLSHIFDNVSLLCDSKPRPEVTLIFQMMKPNIEELPELVIEANKLGADKLIATNIDFTPTMEVYDLRAFSISPNPQLADTIDEALHKGKELGVKVYIYPLCSSDDIAVCDADPLNTTFITVEGEAAPCVYTALPYKAQTPRIFWGESLSLPRFTFGNVRKGFDEVINGHEARLFRDVFVRRTQVSKLHSMSTIATMLTQGINTESSLELPPAPEVCRNCYKLYGI